MNITWQKNRLWHWHTNFVARQLLKISHRHCSKTGCSALLFRRWQHSSTYHDKRHIVRYSVNNHSIVHRHSLHHLIHLHGLGHNATNIFRVNPFLQLPVENCSPVRTKRLFSSLYNIYVLSHKITNRCKWAKSCKSWCIVVK